MVDDDNSMPDKYNLYDLKKCELYYLIKNHPDLAKLVRKNFFKYNDKLLNELQGSIYQSLSSVVKERPDLAEDILEVVKESFKSEKIYGRSLKDAYKCLSSVVKESPDLFEGVFEVWMEALKSRRNTSWSLKEADESLSSVIKAHPKLAEYILEVVKGGFKSEKIYGRSLEVAYECLSSVIKAHSELAKDALEVVNETLKSDKNNSEILGTTYGYLYLIIETRPDLAKGVFEVWMEALKSKRNTGWSLEEAYECLSSVIKAHSELAKDALEVWKEALKSDENNSEILSTTYGHLYSIIETRPDLAKDVFEVVKEALKSDKNNSLSLISAYSSLYSIIETRPDLAKGVFEVVKEAFKSEKIYGRSLKVAYECLSSVIKAHSELAKDALEVVNETLKSDKNNIEILGTTYGYLSSIIETRPDLAKGVFEVWMEALKSEKNNNWSLREAYKCLSSVIKARPDLAKDVFEVVKEALKSDKNNSGSLISAYSSLYSIIETRPDLAKDVFEVVKEALKSDKNDIYSQKEAYKCLSSVIKAHPKLAKDGFDVWKKTLKSEKNNSWSLKEAYECLYSIIETRPELAKDALEVWKEALKSDKNNSESLISAYSSLSSIIKAHPELAEDAFEVWKEALKSDKNNSESLISAYSSLSSIIKAHPELAKDALEVWKEALKSEKNNSGSLKEAYELLIYAIELQSDINKKSDMAKYIIENILLSQTDISLETINLGVTCIKNCRRGHWENENRLIALSQIFRNLTKDEIKYFYDNYDLNKAQEYSFSSQQRCMNVLMAKLGEENSLDKDKINNFRKNLQNTPYNDNAAWIVPASFKGAEVFGCWFPNYIKKATQYLSVHDSVYWLPADMGKQKNETFVSFVQRNLIYGDSQGGEHVRDLSDMEIIAKNWRCLTTEEQKQSFKNILAICRSRKYENQEYSDFGVEAAKWGVHPSSYKDYESIYKAGLKVPEPFDSSKEFKFSKYTGRFLPRDDVRVGFFGKHTNCCQHFDGVGKSCAISSVKDPYSQLFVIENEKGEIIAGSWVWENKDGEYRDICFDNIEALRAYQRDPLINNIYEQVGRYLTQETNCRRVTIGMGHQDANTSSYEPVETIALPNDYGDQYSDANSTQVLLSENESAKPLDKTQESQRFIRDVCFLDAAAMEKISRMCFPSSDAQLQEAGDTLNGLVLVDESEGVVGYCLYNIEEHYISDMAVLPEYRKDKNSSSLKLLNEIVKKVRDIGGEWSAELRDNTSLRYMKTMAKRGLVDLKIVELDHEMSDGSKVYKVKFTPKNAPVRANNVSRVTKPVGKGRE